MSEIYQMKVCKRCECKFATFSELEFDSETLCRMCRNDSQNATS